MARRKAKRSRTRRMLRIVVADATEISAPPGVLVIRTGALSKRPTVLTIPTELLDSFLPNLQAAAHAAEEDYWKLIPAFHAGARSDDNAELGQAKERWILAQSWDQALRHVDDADHPLFLMDYAAHVGMMAAPPFTAVRTLVIFDPLQIRRLSPSLTTAATRAARGMPAAHPHVPSRLMQAQQDWSSMPWPARPAVLPTQKQADDVISGLHTDFLRRPPLIKER
ncbi:hypothetical protein ACIQ7Q_24650 [Streptomyces sp. NPDC096176]|uniref:hypothetical protein n=1 Tax=Streptomyces sp. NPDC096176 TaxID=3366079 RepID=UPI0038164D33